MTIGIMRFLPDRFQAGIRRKDVKFTGMKEGGI
jgi:hypothetical protein